MATKTDGETEKPSYNRQRSNSDPQPAVEVLNAINTDKVDASWKDTHSRDHYRFTLFTKKSKDARKNGEMKSGSLGANTPPPERKSKFAALGKLFKPWKWKRKKKSEKIEKTVVDLERKISVRTSREELIRRGVLKEPEDSQQNHVPKIESVKESPEEKTGEEPGKPVEDGAIAIVSDPVPEPPTSTTVTTTTTASSEASAVVMATESLTTFSCCSSSSITTQAEITPTASINTNTTVSSAHIRPVIVPPPILPSPPVDVPPPPSSAPPQAPPEAVHPQGITVQFDESVTEITSKQTSRDNDADEDSDEDEEICAYEENARYQYDTIPASEPDLSRRPRKSALKLKSDEIPLPSPNQISHPMTSSLTRPCHTSNVSPALPQTLPKPSPQPTPSGRTTFPRPKVRIAVRQKNEESDSDKENLPKVAPTEEETTPPDYDNLPGESDSDDDEIHYRDDMDENSLAAKVARQDSLARFLSNRPSRRELVEKNIIPHKSEQEKQVDREAIGSKLTRRLSLRPSPEELEQRNILHNQTDEEREMDKEEKKRYLIRKLSFRPSIEELRERKIIKFNDYVEVTHAEQYDRRADKPWTRLTPKDKAAIRKELNEFKSKEMEVHEESKHLTRFHRP